MKTAARPEIETAVVSPHSADIDAANSAKEAEVFVAPAKSDSAKSDSSKNGRRAKNVVETTRVRRGPLKIADAYLLRHVIGSTSRGLLWFAGLLLMATIIVAVRKVADGSLDWAGFFELVGSDVPRSLVFTLPMALLYGTVLTFAELSSSGEANALQVGGMSFARMLRAPLLWSLCVAACVFVLQERYVPGTQQKKQSILAPSQLGKAALRKNFQLADPPDARGQLISLIQAQEIDFKSGVMTRPRVQFFSAQGFRQIAANRGVWDKTRNEWRFFDVTITNTDAAKNNAEVLDENAPSPTKIVHSAEKSFALPSPNAMVQKTMTLAQQLDNGNLEMGSISDLRAHRTELQAQLSTQYATRDFASSVRTRRLVRSMTYGIHDKIAAPFVCFFLVLIGAPLALRPQRAGAGFTMGISMIVLFGYFLLWTFAQDFGRGGEVNPILFGYLPLGVTAVCGLVSFWKKSR